MSLLSVGLLDWIFFFWSLARYCVKSFQPFSLTYYGDLVKHLSVRSGKKYLSLMLRAKNPARIYVGIITNDIYPGAMRQGRNKASKAQCKLNNFPQPTNSHRPQHLNNGQSILPHVLLRSATLFQNGRQDASDEAERDQGGF